jgi:NUMOD3 motif
MAKRGRPKGYKMSAESKAKISRSVSDAQWRQPKTPAQRKALKGRKLSAEHKARIGEGVRWAAERRRMARWMYREPSKRDYFLGAVFSVVNGWRLMGDGPEGVELMSRDRFEQESKETQAEILGTWLKSPWMVNDSRNRIHGLPGGVEDGVILHFVDGSTWPASASGLAQPCPK